MDMDNKAIVALVGTVVGWVLGTLTTWWRERLRLRRMAAGLNDELLDIRRQAEGLIITLERSLQWVALQQIAAVGAPPIQHAFYGMAYKEVFVDLGQSQRLSFQLIHSAVDSLNAQVQGLDELLDASRKLPEEKRAEAGADWSDKVKSSFVNAHLLVYYVKQHLANPLGKRVDYLDEAHRHWLQYRAKAEEIADTIIEKSKGIDPKILATTYNLAQFDNASNG
ncbi:hypothetical protein [Variovorax sp. LjRoot178]|uniref:hypothetical protein n=1 Tax=Variovorax sp. LjRoot178 TaxID=3342277 RepID=UPI003ED083B6